MEIYMDIDYLRGHLRYGHLEGDIDMTQEQEDEFQTLLKKDLNNEEMTDEELDKLEDYKEWIRYECHFVLDDYEIDDIGDFCWKDCLN